MAFWLARARNGQRSDHIQRFDPRFWTVDFPRPMLASVTTTAPDALRVACEFHHRDALAGLIWWSRDTLDHPLLAYATDRDYRHTILRFRWRSHGLVPLDQPNGPTLTIEGRDAAGQARAWYVRLWNYATGTPEDARIALPFSELLAGYGADGREPVAVADIDRMFISLVPAGYDGTATPLPARANGWAELSGIACDGGRAMLEIGDVMVPPHETGMCTAYDDSYNQTPARLVRTMRGLGYRGRVVHYVGMSHYYRLVRQADGLGADGLVAGADGAWAEPALQWHRAFLRECGAAGFAPMLSVSFELLAQDCPPGWMQRAHDGAPALTGWEPPSALLSPNVPEARDFLARQARQVVALLSETELPLTIQIGEPWWWMRADGAICLYDAAARAAFSATAPPIVDMRADVSAEQRAVLDQAGAWLADATAMMRDAAREEAERLAPGRDLAVWLLLFTPTVLDPATPELHRANMPRGWAAPHFDGLQLEDYDWLTAGAQARRDAAYAFVQHRLGYPLARQEYLSGFVRYAADAAVRWPLIERGLAEARGRGVPRAYVWALPQVCRDGFTLLPAPDASLDSEDDMQAFDDVLYPLALGVETAISPEFSTGIALTASGHERRNALWADARLRYDVGPGIRSEAELGVLLAFFRARRGAARGFRLADPFDCSSRAMTGTPTPGDQIIGIGDGQRSMFALVKTYGEGGDGQSRRITRPRADSVRVSVGGVETGAFHLRPGGEVALEETPPPGVPVSAGFLFDVPVRFAQDRLDITGAAFAAGEAPSVPLIEIREAV